MKKRLLTSTLIFILIVISLSLYDYFSSRKAAQNAGPTLAASLEVINPPTIGNSGQPVSFVWRIDSATPRTTNLTAIYWAGESSPSALTLKDSPSAVGYTNYTQDYIDGIFELPSDFSVSLTFDRPETIYFRYYAHVDGQHLWSKEYQLQIN